VFQPGVNEELGATAVWGTQQLDLYPQSKKFDGVFGIWYGKGPGVDRCSDVFKHANMAGTAETRRRDRHCRRRPRVQELHRAHQSDHIFKACGLPVFFPSNVQDILDMGLHAFAMSRFSGVWSGMKTIQEVVESSSSVLVDPDRVKIIIPEDFEMPPGGLHIRWPDAPLEQEARLMDYKWYAALAYIRANKLNYNVIAGPKDRFGLIASGKAFNDTRQALADLGLDEDTCHQLGIRLHKVNVVWPLEATITRDFAEGLQEILVVEEKRQVIEYQIKEELYNWRADVRPNVLGKFDEPEGDASGGEWGRSNPSDNWLLRAKADLTPAIIAKAIAKRLKKLGVPADIISRMDERLAIIEGRERALAEGKADTGERAPWFCSGCPHNTSTRVPEGSRAVAGIGCHYMATWMDRSTSTFTQMGGEGVTWVGQAAFTTDEAHFCQPRRRHLLPQRAAGDPPGHRLGREHHLQDPLQRRGRHDGRPAGRRAARRPFGAADHAKPARRRRGQAGHRDRRAEQEVRRRAAARGRDGAPPRRTGPHPARVPRAQGHDRHHLRPDLRDRKAPPPQARHPGGPGKARGHQRAGLRRLRRLLGAVELPVGGAAGDRIRPQAPHQPEHLQQGLFLREGLSAPASSPSKAGS
jgi:hypothetical protein